ncbi:hypothetical protein Tco_0797002 [Tanacetum coccineum]
MLMALISLTWEIEKQPDCSQRNRNRVVSQMGNHARSCNAFTKQLPEALYAYGKNGILDNLGANGVVYRCVAIEGDKRVTTPKGIVDRVNLGLLPSSEGS